MIEETPVLISGCGPVGLTMSLLLSRYGVPHILVEKNERISTLPRARGVTARSVEILNQLGLGEALEAISLPQQWTENFVYTETLAGRVIGKMQTEGLMHGALAAWSPFDCKVAAQDRLDPMFYDAVLQAGVDVRLSTELIGYREEADRAVVQLQGPDGPLEIACRYIVGADGGRSRLRRLAGIVEGEKRVFRSYVNNHLRADLSRYTQGREGTLIWTLAPGCEGLFQMLDGDRFWAVQLQYDRATEGDAWTPERALAGVFRMIGDPDAAQIPFEMLNNYTYTITSMLPERIRAGRVLLVGDAAHQIPPYGGFGMNTGIQTAHNLAWKLAAVVKGEAGEALFDSFESERLEVARRVTEFGQINSGHLERLMRAVREAASPEEQSEIITGSRSYGNWNGLDLGVHYEGPGAYVPDDIPPPAVQNPITDYIAHAKPGWRAPHFWFRRNGERGSSVLLFDRFTLLAGRDGGQWAAAAAALEPDVAAYRVADDGDLAPEVDFEALYGISASGAVLVRPDGHVGLRVAQAADNPGAVLKDALDHILAR